MSFQVLEIAVFNRSGERSSVRLKPGVVNVITGGSKTGKSALIDIVDYCLGKTDYEVAHGVIRDTVANYALLLQTDIGLVLIARPIPPENQKTGTDVFFSPVTSDVIPSIGDMKPNSNVKTLGSYLTGVVGITPNENVPPAGHSTPPVRATIDQTRFYLYQDQNRVSDKKLLFYRQEESWAPRMIQDTLPYFLGAVGDDQLDRQLRLQRARRELKLVERRIEDEEAIKGRDNSRALALVAEANQAGILANKNRPADFDVAVEVLRGCLNWKPLSELLNTDGEFGRLGEERDLLQERLRQIKRDIQSAKAFSSDQEGYSAEAKEQRNRLASIGLYQKAEDEHSCPLCSSQLAKPTPTADEVNQSLVDLDRQLQTVTRQRPRLDEYINRKETEASEIRREISETKSSIEAVVATQEALARMRSEEASQARVAGRISLFLESVLAIDESTELKQKLEAAQDKVDKLEKSLSKDRTDEKLESALKIIGDNITRWARLLELEHSENPLEFDIKKLTVVSHRDTGPIPLSQMGSGENWVGYHLTALLALHKWFVTKSRPVPSFLLLDQPAQYYFPSDIRKESDVSKLKDEDRDAVNRMFKFIFDTVKSMDGKFQVIITEHADLQEDWYQEAVVLRWRGEDKLIPKHWYMEQPEGGTENNAPERIGNESDELVNEDDSHSADEDEDNQSTDEKK